MSYWIAYLSHTRLRDENDPEKSYSFVWEESKNGFNSEVDNHPTIFSKSSVFAPIELYHDMPLYLDIIRMIVKLNPDVIVMPFTPTGGEYEDDLIKILKSYHGIIIAITAAPSERAKKELPNLRGFVGPDESEMGQLAAEGVIATHRPKHVLVPNDKPFHEGYRERILRITDVALSYGVESVKEVFFEVDKQEEFLVEPESDTVIIGLGPKGTSFALKMRKKYPERIVGISTMDMSDETQEAIDAKILYSVVQNPREQGVRAVQMAVDILENKTSAAFIKKKCKLRIIGAILLLINIQAYFLKQNTLQLQCVCSFIKSHFLISPYFFSIKSAICGAISSWLTPSAPEKDGQSLTSVK